MADIATCAKCGDKKELCQSVRVEGVMQPRICKNCLMQHLGNGTEIMDEKVNHLYWMAQIVQLKDQESIDALKAITGQAESPDDTK